MYKYILLIFFPLSGICQTADSVKCYTRTELQAIATTLLDGKEASAQLKVYEQISLAQSNSISSQKVIINSQEQVITTKDLILRENYDEKIALEKTIKKTNRKLRWTKYGWATTSIILSAIIVYVAITK